MAFAFDPEQRESLLLALGRSDSAAWHLVEDVELALSAYTEAGPAAEGKLDLAGEFEQMLTQAAHLRAKLYGLPDRLRQLAVLGAIASDSAAEVAGLAQASGEALDRLSVKLAETDVPAAVASAQQLSVPERLVHAVGQAFRNRLNIKPTVDAHGLFRRFLGTLIDLVARRHADLADLSRAMDDSRLARILESD